VPSQGGISLQAASGLQRNHNPRVVYVYFIYGLHWMLNVVTGPIAYPAAVLIRSVEGIVGPARLTKAIGIEGDLNGKFANRETKVLVE
jgi:DNA-3-methyladenine glycosylase